MPIALPEVRSGRHSHAVKAHRGCCPDSYRQDGHPGPSDAESWVRDGVLQHLIFYTIHFPKYLAEREVVCEAHYETSVLWPKTLIQNDDGRMPIVDDFKPPAEPDV